MKRLATALLCCSLWMLSCAHTGGQSEQVQLPPGTEIWIAVQQDLDSAKLKDGDTFRATVQTPVVWQGKTVMPNGAEVKGHVSNKGSAQAENTSGFLTMVLDSVQVNGRSYDIKTEPQTMEAPALKKEPKEMAQDKVPANMRTALANAVVTKNTVLRFLTSAPVTVDVREEKRS